MGKVYSCQWSVAINGKTLKGARRDCIESIDIEERDEGSDSCTIKVNDPSFHFIEDNIFVEEASISVSMGWHGDTHRSSFSGYISAIDIDFPDKGYPVLSISCIDRTHLMNRKKKSRSWDNVTSAEVVQKIAQEYGLQCVVEPGYEFKKEENISQSDTTDIEFCESLASKETEQFICKLKGNTLYYIKKGLVRNPVATLYYKKYPYDIVSFSPSINKETKQEEVTSSDINTDTKATETATANNDTTSRDLQGDPVKTSSDPCGTPPEDNLRYDAANKEWK